MASPPIRRSRPLPVALLTALALAASWLPGCAAGPAVRLETPVGTVRADDDADAVVLAGLATDLYARVGALLPGAVDSRPEVWLQSQLELPWYTFAGDGLSGAHLQFVNRVHVEASPVEEMSTTLAHEYVHARMDDVFGRLPHALQEGLCDHVAEALVPEFAAEHRGRRLIQALEGIEHFELELHYAIPDVEGRRAARFAYVAEGLDPGRVFEHGTTGFWFLDVDEKTGLYGLGLVAVDRLVRDGGYPGLHAFVEATPAGELAARLAERAGLAPAVGDGDGSDATAPDATAPDAAGTDAVRARTERWRAAVLELFGEEELAAVARGEPALVAGLATVIGRSRFPHLDVETFLDRARPTLRLPHHRRGVPIHADPVVREAVRAAWPVLDPERALDPGAVIEGIGPVDA